MDSDLMLDRDKPENAEHSTSRAAINPLEPTDEKIGAEGVEKVIPASDRDAVEPGTALAVESTDAVAGDGAAVVSREEATLQGQASASGPEMVDDSPETALDRTDLQPSPTQGSESAGLIESTGVPSEATRSSPDQATIRSVPLPDPLGVLKGRTMRFRDPVRSRIERAVDRVFEFLDDNSGDSQNR